MPTPVGRSKGKKGGVVVLLLVAAAIGGAYAYTQRPVDDGDSYVGPVPTTVATSQSTGASATRWTATANAYCRVVDRQLKAIGKVNSYADIPSVLPDTAAVYRAMDQHLRGLPAPAAWRSSIGAMAADWDTTAGYYDAAVDNYQSGDTAGVQSDLNAADQANARGNAIATSLGATDCADTGGL
jgi:hypothetical protein